jgi:hypothetical protein
MMASLKRGTFALHWTRQQEFTKLTNFATDLVLVLNENLLSRLRVKSKLQGREQIRILERKPQFAFVVTSALLERLKNILWNTLQFLSREPDSVVLLIEVLLELNLDLAAISPVVLPKPST